MNIAGLDKAAVLAALYAVAKPRIEDHPAYTPGPMNAGQAAQALAEKPLQYFDFVGGRFMKIDIHLETVDTFLFNRDNGEGAAEKAIAALRK